MSPVMREQHHATCASYLPTRTPWRPFACRACDVLDRHLDLTGTSPA